MSGHNSKKIYDQCYINEFIHQQVNPYKYRIDPIYAEQQNKCHALNGPRSNKMRGTGELGDIDIGYRTEIESQLFNLDVPDSKCITLKTMREKNERLKKIADTKKIIYNTCGKEHDYQYTRLNMPVNEMRSAYVPQQWGYPIIDPKSWIYYGMPETNQMDNERFGINTQLRAKDAINPPNFNPSSNLTK